LNELVHFNMYFFQIHITIIYKIFTQIHQYDITNAHIHYSICNYLIKSTYFAV